MFLSSKYTNNIIKKYGFQEVYNIIFKEYLQSSLKGVASRSLLGLSASKNDYGDFSKDLQDVISRQEPNPIPPNEAENIYLLDELREIYKEILPSNINTSQC